METKVSIKDCVLKFERYLLLIDALATRKTYCNHHRVWMRWLDNAGLVSTEGTPVDSNSPMQDANSIEMIAAFYAHLRTRRKQDGTPLHNNAMRSYQHSIRALWRFCNDQNMWAPERAPLIFDAARIVRMSPHVENSRHKATLEDVDKMVEACNRLETERECALAYAVMQVLLVAGLRRNEMIQLETTDYNTKNRTLIVRAAKGGASRTQRLDRVACDAMDAWLLARGEYVRGRWEQLPTLAWHHVPDTNAPDFLFTLSAKRHMADASVTSLFRRLRAAAGIRDQAELTPHCLRHLQATRIYKDFGIKAAQKFLGHKSERTTWKYIAETSDIEMDDVLDQIQLRPSESAKTISTVRVGRQRCDLRQPRA